MRKVNDSIDNLLNRTALRGVDSVDDRIKKLDEEQKALKNRKAELEIEIGEERRKVLFLELIQNNFKAFGLIFRELSFEDQYQLLHTIIKEITYREPPAETQIEFWNLPEIKMPPKAPAKGTSGGTFSHFDKRTKWLPELVGNKNLQAPGQDQL